MLRSLHRKNSRKRESWRRDLVSNEEVEFKNRDRFIQLGLTIAALRKMQGMSQEQLAEKAKTLNIIRQNFTALLNAPEIQIPISGKEPTL